MAIKPNHFTLLTWSHIGQSNFTNVITIIFSCILDKILLYFTIKDYSIEIALITCLFKGERTSFLDTF